MINQSSKISYVHSNRQFQLKFAHEKYNELQCKLNQRLTCLKLQLEHVANLINKEQTQIQNIATTQQTQTISNNNMIQSYPSGTSQHTHIHTHTQINAISIQNNESNKTQLVILNNMRTQLNNLTNFSQQLLLKYSNRLLIQQQQLEQQSQRYDLIQQYEQRIAQLDCNKYTKQVDISVDHIGKRNDQKPYTYNVGLKNVTSVQLNNIRHMMAVKGKLQTQVNNIIERMEKMERMGRCAGTQTMINPQIQTYAQQQQQQQQQQQYNSNRKLSQLQSGLTKQSSNSSSTSQKQQNKFRNQHRHNQNIQNGTINKSNIDGSNINNSIKSNRVRRMILISSQQKIFASQACRQVDPQLHKMYKLIKNQQQKQQKLVSQYKILYKKYIQMSKISKKLANDYNNIGNIDTGTNNNKQVNNCSVNKNRKLSYGIQAVQIQAQTQIQKQKITKQNDQLYHQQCSKYEQCMGEIYDQQYQQNTQMEQQFYQFEIEQM